MLPLMLLSEWPFKSSTIAQSNFQVNIAMVGKYAGLSDSYLSVLKVTFLFRCTLVLVMMIIIFLHMNLKLINR